MNFDWTNDRIAELSKLWLAGGTASAIAEAMGQGLTREAVLGKVHRLGLKRGDEAEIRRARLPGGVTAREATAAARREKRNAEARAKRKAVSARPQPITVDAEPPPCGVEIHDLLSHHCRWPVEVAGELLRYCGANKPAGARAYCEEHARLAYSAQGFKAGIDRAAGAQRPLAADRQAASLAPSADPGRPGRAPESAGATAR